MPGPVKYTSWTPETGEVEHLWERLIARDLVRIVFFVPRDNFDITAGSPTRSTATCARSTAARAPSLNTPAATGSRARLGERGWELIRDTLKPTERRYADDYTREEAFYPLKDGADPYFGIYGEQDSGFSFQYHARIPWREAPPGRASVLRVTLPTEYLEERVEHLRNEAMTSASHRLGREHAHYSMLYTNASLALES